jgi:choline dehydrogenase
MASHPPTPAIRGPSPGLAGGTGMGVRGAPRDGRMMEADYVIVGAGSAGCAMAFRLAEAGRSVIVIEHGGTDAGPFIQMPAGAVLSDEHARYDWGLKTEPEPHLGGRVLATPRGKVLGGSSVINGHGLCARPCARLRPLGRTGRAPAGPMPMCCPISGGWSTGTAMRALPSGAATDGPLHVTRGPRRNPLFDAFVEAGRQAGYPVTDDYNGAPAGRLRRDGGDDLAGAALVGGQRLSAPRDGHAGGCRWCAAGPPRGDRGGRATGVEVRRGGAIEVMRGGPR